MSYTNALQATNSSVREKWLSQNLSTLGTFIGGGLLGFGTGGQLYTSLLAVFSLDFIPAPIMVLLQSPATKLVFISLSVLLAICWGSLYGQQVREIFNKCFAYLNKLFFADKKYDEEKKRSHEKKDKALINAFKLCPSERAQAEKAIKSLRTQYFEQSNVDEQLDANILAALPEKVRPVVVLAHGRYHDKQSPFLHSALVWLTQLLGFANASLVNTAGIGFGAIFLFSDLLPMLPLGSAYFTFPVLGLFAFAGFCGAFSLTRGSMVKASKMFGKWLRLQLSGNEQRLEAMEKYNALRKGSLGNDLASNIKKMPFSIKVLLSALAALGIMGFNVITGRLAALVFLNPMSALNLVALRNSLGGDIGSLAIWFGNFSGVITFLAVFPLLLNFSLSYGQDEPNDKAPKPPVWSQAIPFLAAGGNVFNMMVGYFMSKAAIMLFPMLGGAGLMSYIYIGLGVSASLAATVMCIPVFSDPAIVDAIQWPLKSVGLMKSATTPTLNKNLGLSNPPSRTSDHDEDHNTTQDCSCC